MREYIRTALSVVFLLLVISAGPSNVIQLNNHSGVAAASTNDPNGLLDSFEDEENDSGAPKKWEATSSPTGNSVLEVTSKKASDGSQSVHLINDKDDSAPRIRPQAQPYSVNITSNLQYDAYNTQEGSASLSLKEGNNRVIQVKSGPNLTYTNSTGAEKTITTAVDKDEWVSIKLTQIDPGSDTFAVEWSTENGESGSASGLEMNNTMSVGYDRTKFSTSSASSTQAESYFDDFQIGQKVTGYVVNQVGQPVTNATARITKMDRTQITASDPTEEAFERLDNASELTPDFWDPSLDPTTRFQSFSGKYPLVFQADVGGGAFSVDAGDVSDPKLSVASGEQFKVTAYDASKSGGFFGAGDYARQQPGATTDGTVVFEQVSPTNETINRITVQLNKTSSDGFGDPSELSYAEVTLPDGYYRYYHEDNPSASVPLRVGQPTKNAIRDQLRTINGELTDKSRWVQDQIKNGPMGTHTVPTNESGYFVTAVRSNVNVVGIQAYKASSLNTDPKNLSLTSVRRNASELDGSIYMPSRLYRKEVPATNVTVRMTEATWPQFGNTTDYQTRFRDWLNELLNGSMKDMPPVLQSLLENQSTDRLQNVTKQLENLTKRNQQLRERYKKLLDNQELLEEEIENNNREELKQRLAALQNAVESSPTTVSVDPVDPTTNVTVDVPGFGDSTSSEENTTDSVISRAWSVPGQVTPKGTLVRIDYANGTTQYLDPSTSDKVSINNRLGRSDVISLTNYDIGNAATAEVSLIAATNNGIGKTSEQITNPESNATIPSLNAVRMSTLVPEVGENTSITPKGGEQFRQLESASVFAPDGTSVPTSVGGGEASFRPTQAGTHTVQLTFSNLNGKTFEETYRVRAVQNGQDRPASVRAKSGPTGTYALVGDGLQSGDIRVAGGGSSIEVTATSPTGQVPGTVHVYTGGLSISRDATIKLSVVKGEQQKAVSQNVKTILHGPAYSESAYIYRVADGNEEPLPQGKSANGIVELRATNSTIQTYLTAEGQVGVRTVSNPTIGEQIEWVLDTRVPVDLSDVPGLGILGAPVIDLNGVISG